MSNAATVLAVRGARNKIAESLRLAGVDVPSPYEHQLEEIYRFLEHRRILASSPDPPSELKVVALPHKLYDWFVPRAAAAFAEATGRRVRWVLKGDEDERQLHWYLGKLHQLGIPTFLCELPAGHPNRNGGVDPCAGSASSGEGVGPGVSLPLLRQTASIEVLIHNGVLPPDDVARVSFWTSVRKGIVVFLVTAMAQVVELLFKHGNESSLSWLGNPGSGVSVPRSNLVAVFDSTGFSAEANQWKLAIRSSFLEVAVTPRTARLFRRYLVNALDESWKREPKDIGSWGAAVHLCSTWDSAVAPAPEDCLPGQVDGTCMIWCDTVENVRSTSEVAPSERPLRPCTLLHARTKSENGETAVEPVSFAAELVEADWARLASVWSSDSEPTERRSIRHDLLPGDGDGAASSWTEYRAEDGKPYFFHEKSGVTTWDRPVGEQKGRKASQWVAYRTDAGEVYYHNPATDVTSWDLPPGGVVVDA